MKILDEAQHIEKETEQYYRDLAAKEQHKGLKKILLHLADEEVKHFTILEKMKEKTNPDVPGTTILADAMKIFEDMKNQKSETYQFDSQVVEMYKKAQNIEDKFQNFYLDKMKELESDEHKKIFKKLADEEKRHFFLLGNIIEFLARPETWLEDAEFYHLEKY